MIQIIKEEMDHKVMAAHKFYDETWHLQFYKLYVLWINLWKFMSLLVVRSWLTERVIRNYGAVADKSEKS